MQSSSLFLFFQAENRFKQSHTCHISAAAVPIDLLLDPRFRLGSVILPPVILWLLFFFFSLWLPVYSKAAVNSLTAVFRVRACSPSTSCTNKERVNRSVVMFKMSQCNIYCCAPGGGFEMKCSLCLSDEGWTWSTSLTRSGGLTAMVVWLQWWSDSVPTLFLSLFFLSIWFLSKILLLCWRETLPTLSLQFSSTSGNIRRFRTCFLSTNDGTSWLHVSSFNTSANFLFFLFFHCGCHLNQGPNHCLVHQYARRLAHELCAD